MAVFLLKTRRMRGKDADLARPMITRSDNSAFERLLKKYFRSSAKRLFTWMHAHYRYPLMGASTPNDRCWGSTRITSQGIARLYAKVAQDEDVRPWLLNSMHHFQREIHGFNQGFGIPAVIHKPAIKQGWSSGCSLVKPYRTVLNSTGFAKKDRYTIAILTNSKRNLAWQRRIIDEVARIALSRL